MNISYTYINYKNKTPLHPILKSTGGERKHLTRVPPSKHNPNFPPQNRLRSQFPPQNGRSHISKINTYLNLHESQSSFPWNPRLQLRPSEQLSFHSREQQYSRGGIGNSFPKSLSFRASTSLSTLR